MWAMSTHRHPTAYKQAAAAQMNECLHAKTTDRTSIQHTHALKSGKAACAVESVYVVAHLALHLMSVRVSGPSIHHVVAVVRRRSGVNRTDHPDRWQASCVCPQ